MKIFTQILSSLIILSNISANAQSIAAGSSTSLFACSGGSGAMSSGENNLGQLGDGTIINKNTPGTVNGLTNVIAVAAGKHSTFLLSDGTVWSCGQNYSGELGNGTTNNSSTPGQVIGLTGITAIKNGEAHTLFLKNDGTVWACGANNHGQLGDGTTVDRSTPVQVSGLTNVVAIAAGIYHSLFLKNDGTVWSCGYNLYTQLGVSPGSTSPTTPPVQATSLTGIQAIAAGGQFSIFVKNDGTMYSSGNSNYGMNAGSDLIIASPTLTNLKSASIGLWHCVFIKNDGTVWSTGLNNHGQLGDGTTNNSNGVQVSNLTGVTEIASGSFFSAFLKNDGTVWTVGGNGYGQLGIGSTTDAFVPTQVTGLCSISTGINNYKNTDPLISVYPNPSSGIFNVSSSFKFNEIKCLTILGETILSKVTDSEKATIDLSGYAKGVYFYQILEKNKVVSTGKLIVD
jgi:alpha-tubulin suppressor-like RCC1 family protein